MRPISYGRCHRAPCGSNRSGNKEFSVGQSFRGKLPHHQVVRDERFVGHLLHEESHARRRADIPNIARPLLIHFDRFLPALTRRR
jgi:hypothetical protein